MLNYLRQSLANLLRRWANAIAPAWQQPRIRPNSHGGKGEERVK